MKAIMKFVFAGLLAAAAYVAFVPAKAEASEVLNRLRSHGLGKWVDEYVKEDSSGKVRYKGAKQDTYSSEYYNNKTGKWTGKKYDGEVKSTSTSTRKSSTKETASLKSTKTYAGKSFGSKTNVAEKSTIRKSSTSKTYQKYVKPDASPAIEPSVAPQREKTPAKVTAEATAPEMYGPPAPAELAQAEEVK